MKSESTRRWLIWWMYGSVAAHLAVGILLPWVGKLSVLNSYHLSIEAGFWIDGAPLAARAQQIWWMSLFGPTVQTLALWMGALVRIGDRYHSSYAWGWLIIGIALWAPQDVLISLQANMWMNVWVDCFAVMTMLPPLIWLWLHDKNIVPTLLKQHFKKEAL